MGLMAKHVMEGKPMIYDYGQGYMGSLEAFVGALIFKLRGIDILSIQLAPITFYLLFLIVNFFLVKRLFGRETSLELSACSDCVRPIIPILSSHS